MTTVGVGILALVGEAASHLTSSKSLGGILLNLVGAYVLVAATSLAINIVRAPATMHADAQRRITDLEGQRTAKLDALVDLMHQGGTIATVEYAPTTAEAFQQWKQQQADWGIKLHAVGTTFLHPYEWIEIETVEIRVDAHYTTKFNDEHEALWHAHMARLKAVKALFLRLTAG